MYLYFTNAQNTVQWDDTTPKFKIDRLMVRQGTYWQRTDEDGENSLYTVVRCANHKLVLINVSTGSRYSDPIDCSAFDDIPTDEQIDQMFSLTLFPTNQWKQLRAGATITITVEQ